MQLISLFSGIGGFELAAEWMGWDVVASCEINPFGQRVLKHYWPEAYHHDDIHTLTYETLKKQSRWDSTRPTILTGGFPCQPYSMAGKRRGKEDDRHLWPEMLRVIREVRPDYIVGENVLGLVSWDGGLVFDEVHTDLEAEGYEVQAVVIPAAAVNAPHGRDRIWFCARRITTDPEGNESGGKLHNMESTDGEKQQPEEQHKSECAAWNFSGQRPTPDTTSESGERLQSEQREFSDTQKREFGGNGGGMGYGPTTDTNSTPTEHPIQTGRDLSASCDGEGAAANTHSLRLEQRTDGTEMGERQKKMGRQGSEFANAAETDGKVSNVTNPNGLRLRGEGDRTGESEQPGETFPRTDWSNFPTQPPVCSRNDGLSTELDGITFSKWRNESIKAAGNAIVPQVAYSIFRCIQSLHH